MGGDLRARWLRGAACAVSLALASGQEPQAPEDVSPADKARAEIDRLIGVVESLQAFRAEYEITTPDGPSEFVLEFEAPGSASLRMTEGGSETRYIVIVDGVMAVRESAASGESEPRPWRIDLGASFTGAHDCMVDALKEHAPGLSASFESRAASATYGPRIGILLRPKREDGASDKRLDIGFEYAWHNCSPFHWLCGLRSRADEVVVSADSIVLELDGAELKIATDTGFVTAVTVGDGEERRELRLARLLRDDEVPGDGIDLPEDASSPPQGVERQMLVAGVLGACMLLEDSVSHEVEADRIEWSEERKASVARALHAFLAGPLASLAEEDVAAQKAHTDARAEKVKSWEEKQLERGRERSEVRDEIRRMAADNRRKLEKSLEEARGNQVAEFLSGIGVPADPWNAEFRDLVRTAALAAWDDAASGPVLAHFDAELVEPWAD